MAALLVVSLVALWACLLVALRDGYRQVGQIEDAAAACRARTEAVRS